MAGRRIQQEETDRRIYRHKRRVRNQIISYIVITIIFAGLVVGGVIGVRRIMSVINDKKQAEELQKQLEELAETENSQQTVEAPEETADPEPPEETDWLEVMVEETIAGMTLEDKAAGLFFITPEALTGTDTVIQAGDTTKEKLGAQPVGGLVYSSKNFKDEAQLKEMLQNTRSYSKTSIFLGVAEEGGSVSPVAESGLAENVGKMWDIGAAGDTAGAQTAGNTIGTYLAGYGFNVNFAPVADVVVEGNALGERAFGTDQGQVSGMVSAFVEGSKSTGVSVCLKYFPGLGDVTGNASEGMVTSDKSIEAFMERDFPVYQAGISAGADLVMVSHLSLPNVTGDNTPASLSGKMVTEILRQQLGFEGIIITDAMNVAAITEYYTAGEAAVKALQAGVDMIFMPEDYTEAYEGVLEAVQNGSVTEEQINESLRRIFRVKLRDRLE